MLLNAFGLYSAFGQDRRKNVPKSDSTETSPMGLNSTDIHEKEIHPLLPDDGSRDGFVLNLRL